MAQLAEITGDQVYMAFADYDGQTHSLESMVDRASAFDAAAEALKLTDAVRVYSLDVFAGGILAAPQDVTADFFAERGVDADEPAENPAYDNWRSVSEALRVTAAE